MNGWTSAIAIADLDFYSTRFPEILDSGSGARTHLLVDEYQDPIASYLVVNALAGEVVKSVECETRSIDSIDCLKSNTAPWYEHPLAPSQSKTSNPPASSNINYL